MDDLLQFLVVRITDDNHAYAYVADTMGGEALLDSHLPMLDLAEQLAHDYRAMDPSDSRSAGLAYALRVLAQAYAEHPAYRQDGAHSPSKRQGLGQTKQTWKNQTLTKTGTKSVRRDYGAHGSTCAFRPCAQ